MDNNKNTTPPPYGDNNGYNNGNHNGYNNGYNNGYDNNGHNNGYNNGYDNNGYNNGYNNNGYNNNGYNNNGYNNSYSNNPYFNEQEYYGRNDAFASDAVGKSRGVAALLAIFLGSLGVHYFYLGKTTAGIITLLLSIVTCSIWGVVMVIQGILMFVMTNAEFDRKYVYNPNSFPLF